MVKEHVIQIDPAKCIGCGLCVRDCPANNIAVADNKAVVKSQGCIQCGHCVAICPKAAVSMTGFDEPPAELDGMTTVNAGALLNALRARRSIRHFKRQPVEQAVLARIVEAGRLTPTGGNAQDVSYLVLQQPMERYEAMAVRLFKRILPVAKLVNSAANNVPIDEHFFFKNAPAVILVVCKNKVNGALAASNMALMAEAEGLGVLYSGFFTMAVNASRRLRTALGLRHGQKVVTTLVLGYADVTYHRTAQKEAAAVRFL